MKNIKPHPGRERSCMQSLCSLRLTLILLGILSFELFGNLALAKSNEQTGEQLVQEKCTVCHGTPDISKLTPKSLHEKLEMMSQLAHLTKKENQIIHDYLMNKLNSK